MMEIEANDIAVRFGPATLLQGVDLVVRAGETVGLIGPNGSGKTTLLRILANLRPPEGGRVNPFSRSGSRQRHGKGVYRRGLGTGRRHRYRNVTDGAGGRFGISRISRRASVIAN